MYNKNMSLKGRKLTEEHKRKIGLANSIALLGKKQSPETIEKRVSKFRGRISPMFGKKQTSEARRKISEALKKIYKNKLPKHFVKFQEAGWKATRKLKDEKSSNWKGDDVKYIGLHNWVRKHLGIPDTCKICGKNGLSGYKIHWANKGHTYKRNLDDWIRLCCSCHQKYDKSYLKMKRDILGRFIKNGR